MNFIIIKNKEGEAVSIPFEISKVKEGQFPNNTVFVKDYLTTGEEHTCIQKAVDACKKVGGGTVVVGKGNWISGSIHLYSNLCLVLEKGAEIYFLQEFEAYLPVVFTRWEGMECYNYSPLIYAKDCNNIAIMGEGKLVGGGEAWWHWKKLQQKAANELCYAQGNQIPVEQRIYGTPEAALRPSFLQFINCKDISLDGFTIEEGPQWTLHPVYCERVCIRNVTVSTTGPNTDGLNPDSCKDVWIEGCKFSTGDDCIAVNSGMNEDGWRVGKPCENIVIKNCEMHGGHGAIVIGSAMSGGVQNIFAKDCKVYGTNQGIRLKSMRGRGGYIRDVWFENIELRDIAEEAIQISMFYPYSTVIPKIAAPPDFSNIYLKNVFGNSEKYAVEIRGLPESKIKNIKLEKICITSKKGLICDNAEQISMDMVEIKEEES